MSLPAALASAESLRDHLRIAAGMDGDFGPFGDQGHQAHNDRPTGAAVLIAIVERPAGLQLILTQRAAHLSAHAGQISFPGGRMEPEDVNAAATALREANEEIGLPFDAVRVLGGLRHYDTVTGFRVHPIVGWVTEPVAYRRDPAEVDEVFEVPLAFVIDPANQQRHSRIRNGERRYYYAITYKERYVWGATAGMLVGFSKLLRTDFDDQPGISRP